MKAVMQKMKAKFRAGGAYPAYAGRAEPRLGPGNAEPQLGPGRAEPQLGTAGHDAPTSKAPKIWRSRAYLPHFDMPGLLQSITFRLADSLPQARLRQLEEELAARPAAERDLVRRRTIDAWLDAGMGCCALRHPRVAASMQDTLLTFDGSRYRLLAWCVMPNHVHVLIEPSDSLSRIVQSWKSYTGRWALARNAELGLGVPGKAFWMRDYWDRYIRDDRHFYAVERYIHENPVKAGLCRAPEDWGWSSAGWK